ncbi:MAG: class I SAM-dependent DNA methyltransferase [Selenomonas ruminantium]|nr:class I SAM-dependent DNA methyltransferase [Selenomonas ruminantium]
MNFNQQKKAAKEFAKRWAGIGDEKQDCQRFWFDLLQNVYDIEDPASFLRFEQKVKLSHTSFIDVMIPATHTMIEQKTLGKDLNAPIKQSDGTYLKPIEQAKRYAAALPYSERPRWIISCNFAEFQVFDMERPNDDPEYIELKNLGEECYRLQFMVDVTSSHITREMDISRDAGALVGKLYNALLPAYGNTPTEKDLQDLNKLIVRLVFCLYAEDAGIFGRRNMFHDFLATFHASDVRLGLTELFKVLDQKPEARDRFLEKKYADFPYVNGSLFAEAVPAPPIDETTFKLLINEACDFDWAKISPTIFGAIFESTLNPDTRRKGGMHYTSIENIHKVIDPLFLNEYRQKFQAAMEEKTLKKRMARLKALQEELALGLYFDPAAGSGNFLTESYLSLRRLENDILRETVTDKAGTGVLGFVEEEFNPIKVNIGQFYGIEINDFAVSVAKTALWIAESQMLHETEDIVNREMDFLPLSTNANIHEGNALRMDWIEVLKPLDNVKILGNPPFVGARLMSKEQKSDVEYIFKGWKNNGNLDYVSCWYKKAADYMTGTTICSALVSTNSICQGDSVAILWKPLFEAGVHIDFAHRTFRWDSESNSKAHVHCVIVGFSKAENNNPRQLYTSGQVNLVNNINGYLIEADNVFVESRNKPLCDIPQIGIGNKPIDGGNYLFTKEEMEAFIKLEPKAEKYFKPWYGSVEFINRKPRYCLWLGDCPPAELRKMPHALKRVQAVRDLRLSSKSPGTQKIADKPTRFHVENMPKGSYIVIPEVSSERRRYVPMGYMDDSVICSNKVRLMPNASLYHFGILNSNVHMSWMRVVCGRLKSDYDYSIKIVYNNFPWPTPTDKQRAAIEKTAQAILNARSLYPNSSLADLYDPVTMPPELLKAHRANDKAVMQAYGFWGRLNSESECVAELMKMYEYLCNESK